MGDLNRLKVLERTEDIYIKLCEEGVIEALESALNTKFEGGVRSRESREDDLWGEGYDVYLLRSEEMCIEFFAQ